MIKLKSLIKEYVSNPIIDLKNYLTMTDDEKKEDFVINRPYLINYWIEQNKRNDSKYIKMKDMMEDYEILELIQNNNPIDFKEFKDWAFNRLTQEQGTEIPSWNVFNYQGIVKNQWLIHFSDNANKIWRDQTFIYGIDDFNKLALSTQYTQESKQSGGYNFAYDIKDFAKYARSSYTSKSWKYGSEAVLVRASGVKAYHYGDEEPQVIFWGKTANDIVYLRYNKGDGDWMVVNSKTNRIIFRAQTLPDVVKWVINNFNQYRNVLLP